MRTQFIIIIFFFLSMTTICKLKENKIYKCSTKKIYIYIQGVKKVPDPKQNYIGLMTEG